MPKIKKKGSSEMHCRAEINYSVNKCHDRVK